ncbi:MAG: hypothetical protein R6U63_10890 [Longimicrobiales bacterium]
MYAPFRIAPIAALLALAAAGCDSGTEPTGALNDLNADAVASLAEGMLVPSRGIVAPVAALRDAFPVLTEQGVSFRRAVAADLVFPTELTGQTFVYDVQAETWVADSARTAAPADGIRVVWYDTDPAGNLLLPLDEEGYVDLTDEDSGGALSRIGIRIMGTAGDGDVSVADFSEGLDRSGAEQWSETFTAAGFYGGGFAGGDRIVDFDVVSQATGDTVSGDQQFTIDVTLEDQDAVYSLAITGSEEGASDANQQTYLSTVVHPGGTTELDLDIVTDEAGNQSGSGTLSHDGIERVRITIAESDFSYSDIDGNALSPGEAGDVDGLVLALFTTGYRLLFKLPLLFL